MKHTCSGRNGLMHRGLTCNCLARFARLQRRRLDRMQEVGK